MPRRFARRAFASAAAALAFVLSLPAMRAGGAAPEPPGRIVSLMPSVTEDLFAIGAGDRVVASSSFTTYPAEAARLPHVNSFSSIDTERIAALRPDLVVGDTSQEALVRDVRRLGLPVVLLDENSYESIFRNLRTLGALTQHAGQANLVIRHLRARTAAIVAGVRASARGRTAPRVFVVLGVRPIYTVGSGSYLATLLRFAGLRNAATNLTDAYAPYDAEALVASDPDAIVADPSARLGSVLGSAPWNALRAVRDRRVFEIAHADVLERPGPRFDDGLDWLVSVGARLR